MYSYEYRRRLPHFQPDFKSSSSRSAPTGAGSSRQQLEQLSWTPAHGLVVMPDHVHLALAPISRLQGPIPIAEIMQTIKGTSAHQINKLLNRRGQVWQEESFDRALRKEEQVIEKLFYMMENPVRAGLVTNPLDYSWTWRPSATSFQL